ncbi:MAG TPA: CHAT domain-containing protein [Candidatus Acidoferrales bacterium]|nr:CHAT domain-containing protein [Candidatus Acidoferrales bacterium]
MTETILRMVAVLAAIAGMAWAEGSRLQEALELQRNGKLKEAADSLNLAIPELRGSGDDAGLARALSAAAWISVSRGDEAKAIGQATEAVALRRKFNDTRQLGDDLNTIAVAHQNLGDYRLAMDFYRQALMADRAQGDAEGEIARLNNIGNVFYFQGRYLDALRSYEDAQRRVEATSAEPWNARQGQLTTANLATLYQRLGQEQRALELYLQLAAAPQAMPPRDRAQLLLNEGVLYRRLGDPVKALETYTASQQLYAAHEYRDGEIGALRNIGIARAVDLGDLRGALDAFAAALRLAQQTSNSRGIVQSSLYRGEVLRRLHRLDAAQSDATVALDLGRKQGLVEEQWKALYLLGRIHEDSGDRAAALQQYGAAAGIVESVRSGLQIASLRVEFLADKRDVYDSIIALRLRQSPPPLEELFKWMERSRARTLQDRFSTTPGSGLKTIQSSLAPDTVLLEFWLGSETGATLWITSSASGIVRHNARIGEMIADLQKSLQESNDRWKEPARALGAALLTGVPVEKHVLIVPDGALVEVPFEALVVPDSNDLLIERADVSYLPSAQFVARTAALGWRMPWRKQLVAFGDPPAGGVMLAGDEQWQPLAASAGEVRTIARLLPGRVETHLGAEARKLYLLDKRVEGVPLLHFSTHAVIDAENPERSRILLAADSAGTPGYIFQGEVASLDLNGVELVTVSACDTARGKMVRGEGAQAFSHAFLAAGARATVTSLWRVADRAAADFMEQFYYFLARRETKAQALRSARLRMIHSRSSLAHPRYWAAFVLNGDGWNAISPVIPWSAFAFAAALLLGVVAARARSKTMAARIKPQTELGSLTHSRP